MLHYRAVGIPKAFASGFFGIAQLKFGLLLQNLLDFDHNSIKKLRCVDSPARSRFESVVLNVGSVDSFLDSSWTVKKKVALSVLGLVPPSERGN